MRTSETIAKIAPAMLAAQKALKVALKDAKNPHFNSKFADLTSIIEVAQKPLNDSGISFLQPVSFNEGRVVVETFLLHESGEWLSEALEIPLTSKQDAQAVGSAVSYGRRYGLQSFIGIRADDDDGNSASAGEALKPQPMKRMDVINASQAEAFRKACTSHGKSADEVKAALADRGITSSAKIPAEAYDVWMEWAAS